MLSLVALTVLVIPAAEPADWKAAESPFLRNIRALTTSDVFARAGEGYFAPDGTSILFQGEEKGVDNPFYQIFHLDLASGKFRRVSPGVGRTTCSYFRPDGKKIIFASSHLDPEAKKRYAEERAVRAEEAKSRRPRRYVWDFDPYYDIWEANRDGSGLRRLTTTKGYDAEGSYSPDGKQIVFCSNRSGEKNLELYIMDADGNNVRQLTHAPGCYNGGPFFSPDGKRVIFRADRKKPHHLQLYVIDVDGKNERALTDDLSWVQWAPYWHPDNRHIIYTAADHSKPGRPNYDLYWMRIGDERKSVSGGSVRGLRHSAFPPVGAISPLSALSAAIPYPFRTAAKQPPRPVRLTFAPGADVLPVFSPDGKKVMWSSTRDGKQPGAQLYIADFTPPKED